MQNILNNISLKNLTTLERLLYQKDNINKKYEDFLKLEYTIYDKLTIDQAIDLYSKLDTPTLLNENETLINNLDNINELDPSYEKIKFNLIEKIMRSNFNPTDNLSSSLFEANKKRYLIIEDFESNLRNIYFELLSNHLESSDKMSDDYKNYIRLTLNKLKFIYKNNKVKETTSIYIEDYIYSNIYEMYLHNMIEILIKKILSFSNSELENDELYANAICYQTLLRSLFIILDDYEYLAKYEEIYNTLETKETIAKSIVRSSFISNYKDTLTYKRKKDYHE